MSRAQGLYLEDVVFYLDNDSIGLGWITARHEQAYWCPASKAMGLSVKLLYQQ